MDSQPSRSFGLHDLSRVPLLPEQESAIERMREVSMGSALWCTRKLAEVRELFALEQVADRMIIRAIDPRTELLVVVSIQAPVATLPPGQNELVIGDHFDLALRYPEEILRGPLPGHAIASIVSPGYVHHANVGWIDGMQPLCIGANTPRGIPLREVILAAYAALTMQSVAIDEYDPAGVMRREVALWWQANREQIPLSKEPFLAPRSTTATGGTP